MKRFWGYKVDHVNLGSANIPLTKSIAPPFPSVNTLPTKSIDLIVIPKTTPPLDAKKTKTKK